MNNDQLHSFVYDVMGIGEALAARANLIKQVYPYGFGLDASGLPTPAFRAWLDSDAPAKTWKYIFSTLSTANEFYVDDTFATKSCHLTLNIKFEPQDPARMESIWSTKEPIFATYLDALNSDVIYRELNETYHKKPAYIYDENHEGALSYDYGESPTVKNETVEKMRRCHAQQPEHMYIKLGTSEFGPHMTGIYLNFAKRKFYYVDSATPFAEDAAANVTPAFIERMRVYNLFLCRHLDIYFRIYFGMDIRLVPLEMARVESEEGAACDRSIQGNSGLCGIWTYYSIVTHLNNPDLEYHDIYRILRNYRQLDRDRIILRFMYYMYSQNSETIDAMAPVRRVNATLPVYDLQPVAIETALTSMK